MSFLDQLKMTRALEEKGREEIAAKKKAEGYISRAKATMEASKTMGVEAKQSLDLLEEAEQEMLEKDYHQALELSHRALEIIEGEAQTQILDRYIQLRRIFTVGMVPPSADLDTMLLEGEQALSTSIPHSVDMANKAYQAIHAYLIGSKPVLRDKVGELFPDKIDDERISIPLEGMMAAEGDAETIHAAMERVLDGVGTLLEERVDTLRRYQGKLSQFLGEMEFMDIIWNDVREHLRENDFERANEELDLIEKDLDDQLERGFPEAVEKAGARIDALEENGSPYPGGKDDIEKALQKFEDDPLLALDVYVNVMDGIRERESDLIANMIQDIRDMVTVGRHVNIDLEDVIIGLDDVRQKLNSGELKAAISGVEEVKVVLLDKMSGYNELELAFFSLGELVKEVDEYDLSLEEPMEIVDEAREVMVEGDFERSLSMVKDAMRIIHSRTKDLLGSRMIIAQTGLQAGFRMDADILEDSNRLGEIFEAVQDGRYKGMMDEIDKCRRRIDSKLHSHAKSYLEGFLALIEERQGQYDVKKMRLQAKGAEKLLKEGSADESYRIIWTARRQLANLDLDALESKLKKVRELVATGEAVEVDISDLKKRMFSFTYDGRKVDLRIIKEAEELANEVEERLYRSLLGILHTDHILTYQAKMVGYHMDDQLASLKKAFRLLESGEYRSAYGALREADIGYNIQILVHDEVYERFIRIAKIIEKEGLGHHELEETVRLFQNGKYREADVESKKMLRALIERGLKTAAAGILEDSRKLVETGDLLDLKIVSLRESLPQAEFFLENEDYRNASSLMEKAIRTARAEISRSVQDRIVSIRPRIAEPLMEKRDKSAALDMLDNARNNMESGSYDLAVEILIHLEEDLERRTMLLNRARMAQMRARDFMGLGKMLGRDIEDQEKLWESARSLLREGKSIMAYETWERVVDQVGDHIAIDVRKMQDDASDLAKKEGLAGPDLDHMMLSIDGMVDEVRGRRFHAAKDAATQIDSCLQELRLYREETSRALKTLRSLRDEMMEDGMDGKEMGDHIEKVESLMAGGEFHKGLELSEGIWFDAVTALGTFRYANEMADILKGTIEESPDTWSTGKSEDGLDKAMTDLSSWQEEEGLMKILALDRELDSELKEGRDRTVKDITALQKALGEEPLSDLRLLPDKDLEAVFLDKSALLEEKVSEGLKELRSAFESSGKGNINCREMTDSAEKALNEKEPLKALELFAQACMCLDRNNDGARKAMAERTRILRQIDELKGYGVDASSWDRGLRSPPIGRAEVDGVLNTCMMRIDEERRGLMPKLTVDRVEDHLVVRNHGPGVARNITVGDHLIPYLGIGRSRALPSMEEGTVVDIRYFPLSIDSPRVIRAKV